MTKSRRKMVLRLAKFLSLMTAIATCVLAYAVHQMQLARVGDMFDQVVAEQTQALAVTALVLLGGVSVVATILFVGFYVAAGKQEDGP